MPLLARVSGKKLWLPHVAKVRIQNSGENTIPLHWMRLVSMKSNGVAEPVISQGSGDLVSLGKSDGFIEIPPGLSGEGPWPYYPW
jgi:molybdopterin molybdotransferase